MRRFLSCLLAVLSWPVAGQAAVKISFYSRDLGVRYPHAFIVLTGTLDATGEAVEGNFGWTSGAPSIVILVRKVGGKLSSVDAAYIAKSREDFSLILSDDEYRLVLARLDQWRNFPQPSYDLNTANCVYFVADIATTLGLEADPEPGLMLKPKSFLQHVRANNLPAITARTSVPSGSQLANQPQAVPVEISHEAALATN